MIGTNLAITTKNYAAGGAVAYDADALAYFTANTAITSDADKNALNTFYLGLKSDGIYTKIKAMYLPIWSSASANKWNLVNPLDTNGAFRLNFSTGWTHTSTGMTPLNAYADTFLNAQTVVNTTNHLSYYSRTLITDSQVEVGVFDSTASTYNQIRVASNYYAGGNSGGGAFTTTLDARGFWLGTKRSNSDRELYLNGISQTTITSLDSNNLPNGTIYLGARKVINPNSVDFYSNKQCAFASIGDGLTDAEASNFYTRVNTLITYFGINV